MSRKFKLFLNAIKFGLDTGDVEATLGLIEDMSLQEENEEKSFENFFRRFYQLIEEQQIDFLKKEVKKLEN